MPIMAERQARISPTRSANMAKRTAKMVGRKTKLEVQYAEIVKQLQTTFGPLPDNTSLAQPSPFRVLPTFVTYSAYEEPILG